MFNLVCKISIFIISLFSPLIPYANHFSCLDVWKSNGFYYLENIFISDCEVTGYEIRWRTILFQIHKLKYFDFIFDYWSEKTAVYTLLFWLYWRVLNSVHIIASSVYIRQVYSRPWRDFHVNILVLSYIKVWDKTIPNVAYSVSKTETIDDRKDCSQWMKLNEFPVHVFIYLKRKIVN